MGNFIRDYVTGCAICQSTKNNTHPTKAPLVPITTEEEALPFEIVSMDFITGLPKSKGFDSIFVVVDQGSSKGVVFAPCNSTITAEGTADLYQENVWKRFGLPWKQISDRGPQFAAQFMDELCQKLGIERALSTAFHPQTDGETERVNQELEQYLRAFCNFRQDDWSDYLSTAEFAHNLREHSATHRAPFEVIMGYHPRTFQGAATETKVEKVHERLERLKEIRREVHAAIQLSARLVKEGRSARGSEFEVGDMVWLEGKNIATTHPSAKLTPKRHGPFKITKKLGPVTYKLELPPQWKIHPVFHITLLTRYHENETHGPNYTRPPLELVDGEKEFEVERIDQSKVDKGLLYYLVKWEGWPESDNTWQRPKDLGNAMESIRDFHKRFPAAPFRDTRKGIKEPWDAATILQVE